MLRGNDELIMAARAVPELGVYGINKVCLVPYAFPKPMNLCATRKVVATTHGSTLGSAVGCEAAFEP